MAPLEPVLAFSKLCEVWLSGRQPGVREAARLLGLIVLSCKHVELSATSSAAKLALGQARGCLETVLASKPLPPSQPRNPVLLALKLSVMARLEARRHEVDGCRQNAARLVGLQALFECLALALLETTQFAVRAPPASTHVLCTCMANTNPWLPMLMHVHVHVWQADQMTQSQDSQWVASKVRFQPAAVFSFWLTSATPYAAKNGCRLFSSSSLVHSHVKGLFLPMAEVDTAAGKDAAPDSVLRVASRWLLLALVNLAWLPLLTVAPESWVVTRATRQRLAMQSGDRELWVAWLLPCGRTALRFASVLALAGILTIRVPNVSSLSKWDALLAIWAAALLESIATQIWHQGASVFGWLTDDIFNALESATLLLLLGVGGCAAYDIIAEQPQPSELGVALQSFAVLVACARLLEVSYVFPKAGPQLLTVQFLVADLWHVSISLLSPLLLAVACAFVVLKQGFTSQPTIGLAVDGYLDVLRLLIGATINSEPQDLQDPPIDGKSGKTIIVSSFLLAALFGLLVILLLLSMIVARFSLTFSNISHSIDAIYKLKFAQMTVLYTARLRSSQLAPQPFNLLRRAMLTIYALAEIPFAAHRGARGRVQEEHAVGCTLPPARGLSRRMSGAQDINTAAARVGAAHWINMAVEVERFVQRATSHAKIFPEMLSEQCASQEHRIVDEAGCNQMQVTMEQVDGLRLHILQIQGQLDQLSHTADTGGHLVAPLARNPARSALTPR